jgi:hypothetical protein
VDLDGGGGEPRWRWRGTWRRSGCTGGVDLDGGHVGGVDLDGGGGRRGTSMEVVRVALRRTRRRSGQ